MKSDVLHFYLPCLCWVQREKWGTKRKVFCSNFFSLSWWERSCWGLSTGTFNRKPKTPFLCKFTIHVLKVLPSRTPACGIQHFRQEFVNSGYHMVYKQKIVSLWDTELTPIQWARETPVAGRQARRTRVPELSGCPCLTKGRFRGKVLDT